MINRLFNKITSIKTKANAWFLVDEIVDKYQTEWNTHLSKLTQHADYETLKDSPFFAMDFLLDSTKYYLSPDYSSAVEKVYVAVDNELARVMRSQLIEIESFSQQLPESLKHSQHDARFKKTFSEKVLARFEQQVAEWLVSTELLPSTYEVLYAYFAHWRNYKPEKTQTRATQNQLVSSVSNTIQLMNERYHSFQKVDYFSESFFKKLLTSNEYKSLEKYQKKRAKKPTQSIYLFFLLYFFIPSRVLNTFEEPETVLSLAFSNQNLGRYHLTASMKNRLLGFHVPALQEIHHTLTRKSWIKNGYFFYFSFSCIALACYMLYSGLQGVSYPWFFKEIVGLCLTFIFFLFVWEVQIKTMIDEDQYYLTSKKWQTFGFISLLASICCFYMWWQGYIEKIHVTPIGSVLNKSRWFEPILDIVLFDWYFLLGYVFSLFASLVLMFSVPTRGNRLILLAWISCFVFVFFITMSDMVGVSLLNQGKIYAIKETGILNPLIMAFIIVPAVLSMSEYVVVDKYAKTSQVLAVFLVAFHYFSFNIIGRLLFMLILVRGAMAFYAAELVITFVMAFILLWCSIMSVAGIDMRMSDKFTEKFLDRDFSYGKNKENHHAK